MHMIVPQTQSIAMAQTHEPLMYYLSWSDETYLCGVVDLERGLALRVEVAVVFERVKSTNNDLSSKRVSSPQAETTPGRNPPPDLIPAISPSRAASRCTV
jgi:hypothetical protein